MEGIQMALDLGPCRVYYGVEASETDVGKTQGGVRVSFSQTRADLLSDQYGTEPEDQVITGQAASVVVPLADFGLTNLALALNQSIQGTDPNEGIGGRNLVGTKLKATGQSLLLKKYVNGAISEDKKDWIRFPVAASEGTFEIRYDGTNQRIIEATFRAFPDADEMLYFIGDETVVS